MMRMGLHSVVAVMLLVLGGCATTPPAEEPADYGSLYDGKATVAYATQFPSASPEEANRRGDEALVKGDTDLALFQYVNALELGGADDGILYKIGRIHANRGNIRLARLAYQSALKVNSNHAGAHQGLGLILLERREYEAAEQHLEQAVALEPERWQAQNGLGVLADLRGEYPQAVSHYLAALKILPDFPQLLNNLGYSKYLSGDWAAAQRNFQKALNKDPYLRRAWLNLGLTLARLGQYEDSLNAFRQVLDEPQAWNNVGYVCMLDGKYDPAESFFLKAIALSPTYYVTAQENLERVQELRISRQ